MTVSTIDILFNVIIWFFLFLLTNRQIKTTYNNQQQNIYFIGGCLIIIYSTFGFNSGDFRHYAELYNDLVKSQFIVHVEPFYFWLCKILPNDYYLWRLMIWGSATIFLIKTFKRINTNPQFALLIFTLILMMYFHNPRQTLGYTVLYYGITLLFYHKENKQTKPYNMLIGLIWVSLSFFLHKSMFIFILLMAFSLIPLGKKLLILSLIAFPIVYKSITYISSYILLNSFANETSQESGTGYLESDFRIDINTNGILRLIIERLPIFLLMFYAIRNIYFKNEKVQYGLKVFLQYTYWLIYISYLFNGQEVSAFLTNRFWDASLYPLTIFLAGYLYKKPRSRFIKNCFYLLILSNLYNLSYTIYKTL